MPLRQGQLVSDFDWRMGQVANVVGAMRDRRQRKREGDKEAALTTLKTIMDQTQTPQFGPGEFARHDAQVRDLAERAGAPEIYSVVWKNLEKGKHQEVEPQRIMDDVLAGADRAALQAPAVSPFSNEAVDQGAGRIGGTEALRRHLQGLSPSEQLLAIEQLEKRGHDTEKIMDTGEEEIPEGMTREEVLQARRIKLGLDPSAGQLLTRKSAEERAAQEALRFSQSQEELAEAKAAREAAANEPVEEYNKGDRARLIEAEIETYAAPFAELGFQSLNLDEKRDAQEMLRKDLPVGEFIQNKILSKPANVNRAVSKLAQVGILTEDGKIIDTTPAAVKKKLFNRVQQLQEGGQMSAQEARLEALLEMVARIKAAESAKLMEMGELPPPDLTATGGLR